MAGARALICCCLLLAPLPALADDAELAKQYYKLGQELYDRADYEGALKQFRQAYTHAKRPALLYNMARCHESLGQHEKAIALYTEYLKSNPDNVSVIEARITNLRKLVQRKPVEPPPTSTTAITPVRPVQVEPQVTPQPVRAGRPLRLVGWISIGTGGALLVTGAILGGLAIAKTKELEDANRAGKDYSTVRGMEDTRSKLKNASIGTLVAGGAVAATGVVLVILDARSASSERRAWLAPEVGPGGAGVVAGLRF